MTTAYAHGVGASLENADSVQHVSAVWQSWTLDPALIVLCLMLWLFVRGFIRGQQRKARITKRKIHLFVFLSGILLVAISLCSPIDALADSSFVWHMLQHMLITLCGAPLILLGAPFLPIAWGFSSFFKKNVFIPLAKWEVLRWVIRTATHPAVALGHQVSALALWHLPFFYNLALSNPYAHWGEHFHFFLAAMCFWWVIISPYPFNQRRSPFLRMGLLVLSTFSNSVVSAMVVFSSEPLYAYQFLPHLGVQGALADQRLGAGLMWTMGTMLHLAGIAGIFIALSIQAQQDEPTYLA